MNQQADDTDDDELRQVAKIIKKEMEKWPPAQQQPLIGMLGVVSVVGVVGVVGVAKWSGWSLSKSKTLLDSFKQTSRQIIDGFRQFLFEKKVFSVNSLT